MLRGEFEIIIRDSKTLEVLDRIVQPNVVTTKAFEYLSGNRTDAVVYGNIVTTDKIFTPSRTSRILPKNNQGANAAIGGAIPGQANPDYFAPTDTSEAFAQWSTRIPLPALGTTRTINTVCLTNCGSQYWLDYGNWSPNGEEVFAYTKLATPCTQTDTQFFDIYYRLYFSSANQHDMPDWAFQLMTRKMVAHAGASNNGDWRIYSGVSTMPLPHPVAKNDLDKNRVWPSGYGFYHWSGGFGGIGQSSYYRRKYNGSLTYTDWPGKIISSFYFWPASSAANIPSAFVNVGSALPKIQPMIGHRATSNRPFYDVDNLQQGTGKIHLSGDWQNRFTPAVPGLFSPGKFPEMKFIRVVGNGGVGSASYTYTSRKYFGSWYTAGHPNEFYTPATSIPALATSYDQGWVEEGKNMLGPNATFGVRQMSASCPYDKTSMVIVKTNEILLYNLATGDYWFYTGGFTEVRQVAVVNGLIYVSCLNTGLWVIDPVTTGTVTSLAAPTPDIDASKTYGVALGHNNSVWVVCNNCLASFNGTTWTKYDETTTPAFNMPGISNGLWSNIEYLSVDFTTPENQMLLVRRYNATVNAASLGVWWSTNGAAGNAFNDGGGAGNPRLNRSQVSGRGGYWVVVYATRFWRCAWGQSSSPTAVGATVNFGNGWWAGAFGSVMWVKNHSDEWRLFTMCEAWSQQILISNNDWDNFYFPIVRLIDASTGNIEASVNTSSVIGGGDFLSYPGILHSGIGPGNYDMQMTCMLDSGVVFNIYTSGITNTPNHFTRSWLWSLPFDSTNLGGALAYIGETSYGWNGVTWVKGDNTPKLMHSTPEPLGDDGVIVAFEDGAGTSFYDTDWYNFGACEGLLKDNSSTCTFEYSFYYKRAYRDRTSLSGATQVPAAASKPVGVVLLDLPRSCSNHLTQNANEIIFEGQNHGQFAAGDKQVTGLFDISFSTSSNPLAVGMLFGIGYVSCVSLSYYFEIGPTGAMFINYPNARYSIGGTIATNACRIRRTSLTQIDFLVNNVVQRSATIPSGQLCFDIFWYTNGDWQPQYQVANRAGPACTILANGSDVSLKIGEVGSATGAYNPKFFAIDDDTRGAFEVTIDGVVATPRLGGIAPNPGEVGIEPWVGALQFHTNDIGKPVTARYTYMTHE